LAVAPALAACGGSGGSSSSSTGTPAATGSPKRGGSIKMGISGGGPGESYKPNNMGASWIEISRAYITFVGLTRYDNDARPQLALADEFVAKSPTVWQVRLKQGLEFHNGKTIDADDVIYSIAHIKKGGYDSAQLGAVDVKRIKKLDARTIELHLSAPNAVLPASFATPQQGIIPAGWKQGDKVVGAGPFVLTSFKPGQQSEHTRFANYFDAPRPYLDSLTIRSLPDDSARVNAFLSGAVDMIDSVPSAQFAQLKQAGKATYSNAKTTGAWEGAFAMNGAKAPFTDPKVRLAFKYLVNRKQMVNQLLAGGELGRAGNDVWGVGDPAFIGDKLPQHEYDPEKAKALLAQAGMSDLRVSLNTAPFSGGVVDAATVAAQQINAANAGVKVKLVNTSNDAFYAGWPNWQFFSTGWGTKPYLVQCATSVVAGSPSDELHWKDPKWISLYNEALGTVDETKRNQIIGEMMRIDHESAGYLIWSFSTLAGAYDPKVQGLENDVDVGLLNRFGVGGSNLWIKS
jgi:peptide/nickel transport system substrate-binding protein